MRRRRGRRGAICKSASKDEKWKVFKKEKKSNADLLIGDALKTFCICCKNHVGPHLEEIVKVLIPFLEPSEGNVRASKYPLFRFANVDEVKGSGSERSEEDAKRWRWQQLKRFRNQAEDQSSLESARQFIPQPTLRGGKI